MYEICYLLSTTNYAHALICDYGENHAFSDSFRGIKNQKLIKDQSEILKYSGSCDLSSYVNFKALRKVVHSFSSLKYGGMLKQGDFLCLLLISQRLKILQQATTNIKQKEILKKCLDRLIDENQMGEIYKFFYVYKKHNKPVYPFLDDILQEYGVD